MGRKFCFAVGRKFCFWLPAVKGKLAGDLGIVCKPRCIIYLKLLFGGNKRHGGVKGRD